MGAALSLPQSGTVHETSHPTTAVFNREPLPVLMYHAVCKNELARQALSPEHRFYSLTADQFEQQMRLLSEKRYQTCLLRDVLNGQHDARSVALTFDDGCDTDYLIALPSLRRYGFRAEFFVTIDHIGRPGFVTWDQLRQLAQAGMSVQCHGLLHRPLTQVPYDLLVQELTAARRCLERNLRTVIEYLAVPGGFVSSEVYKAAFNAGFQAVCNSETGLAHPGRIICRMAITSATSGRAFCDIVQQKKSAFVVAGARSMGTSLLKRIIGVNKYESLKQKVMA